ncbi:MAG: acyltransferase family protein [Bacteroidaceae bacterium]|nr:acyltransferase family protein [Bacteroidaceae bacterium]
MKRIAYIDLMKVYAIFLVILGHSTILTGYPKQWIYSFHMPLFFALYGMTYNIDRHVANGFLTVDFVKHRFTRLMVPAIIWAIGYSIATSFFDSSFQSSILLRIFYFSQSSLRSAGSLTSIWFIPCMFLAVLLTELTISFIYNKISRKIVVRNIMILIVIAVYAFVTFALPRISRGYPWCTNLVPLATAMILIGYLVRQIIDAYSDLCAKQKFIIPIVLILSFAILCLASWYNWHFITGNNVDMASAKFGNPLLYIIGAVAGLFMIVALSKLTSTSSLHPAVAFIGANTYGVFLIHKPIIVSLGTILATKGYGNLITAFISAIIVLIISGITTYIIDKICPILIGNKKKTSIL